jgi:hypothetical protein
MNYVKVIKGGHVNFDNWEGHKTSKSLVLWWILCDTVFRVSLGYMIPCVCVYTFFVCVYTFSPVVSCFSPFRHVFCLFPSFYSRFHIFLTFSSVFIRFCQFYTLSYIFLRFIHFLTFSHVLFPFSPFFDVYVCLHMSLFG